MSTSVKSNSPCYVFSYPADGTKPSTGDGIVFDATLNRWKVQNITGALPHPLLDGNINNDTVNTAPLQGYLIKGNATPKWDRFALGTALQLLRVNAAGTDLEWFTLAGGSTFTHQRINLGADFSTTSATMVDVTGMTITLPNRANGYAMISFVINAKVSGASGINFRLVDNGVALPTQFQRPDVANDQVIITLPYVTALNGQVVKLQANSDGAITMTVQGTGISISYIESLEISSP